MHPMDYLVLDDAAPGYLPLEPIIVEVGGNTGEWTSEALEKLDPSIIVVFEPQQAAMQQLQQRLSFDDRVQTVLAAAGAHEDRGILYCSSDLVDVRASLYRPADPVSTADVAEARTAPAPRMEKCNIRPIDNVLGDWNVPRIDFLKIDAEGAELAVLQGAASYVKTGIPLIQFEYNDMARGAGVRWREIYEFLTGHGYTIFQAREDWPEHGPDEPEWIDSDYVARRA